MHILLDIKVQMLHTVDMGGAIYEHDKNTKNREKTHSGSSC